MSLIPEDRYGVEIPPTREILSFKQKKYIFYSISISWLFIFLIPRWFFPDLPPYLFWPWIALTVGLPWFEVLIMRIWQIYWKNEKLFIAFCVLFTIYFIHSVFF